MINLIWVLIGLCMFAVAVPAHSMERFALVVGHEFGTPGEEPLRFANHDARRVRDVLFKLGSVQKKNAETLENPNQSTLERTIRELGKRAAANGKSNMLFFFFAGHGDERSIHLGNQRLPRDKLLEWLEQFPAKLRVVIIDSCQTTSVSRVRGVRVGDDFEIGIVQVPQQQGTVLISSSSKGEPAHESDLLEGAIFTHFMVSALLGSADVDQDGRISLQEAFTYSYRNTVRHSAKGAATVQHPSFNFDIDGSGEIVLTNPGSASAVLVLPPQNDGSYLVFKEASGTVVAEVITSAEKPVSLAVPTGRLLVQRRMNGAFQRAQVSLPYGGRYVLKASDFENIPYEQTLLRGGNQMGQNANFIAVEGVAVAEFLNENMVPKFGPQIRYTHTFRRGVTLGSMIAFTFSNHQNSYLETRRNNMEWGVELGKRFFWGVVDLSILAIPQIHIRWQHRSTALDKTRLENAGLNVADTTNTAMALGGALQFRLRVPLYKNLSIVVSVECALLAVHLATDTQQEWTTVPAPGGTIGLGYIF